MIALGHSADEARDFNTIDTPGYIDVLKASVKISTKFLNLNGDMQHNEKAIFGLKLLLDIMEDEDDARLNPAADRLWGKVLNAVDASVHVKPLHRNDRAEYGLQLAMAFRRRHQRGGNAQDLAASAEAAKKGHGAC